MKNRKLQIGIIGGGMIAERHMNNFKMDERTEILWVADIEYNTLKRIASRFDVPNSTRDYREMLKDHNLDAVVVSTPPDSHCRIGLDVMRAGKHLMMEKPLAPTVSEAKQLLKESEKHKNLIITGCSCRHARLNPKFDYVKKLIDSGKLGRVYFIHHQSVNRQARAGIEYNPTAKWFLDRNRAGGGPLYDWGVYDLSFHLGIVGEPDFISAEGFCINGLDSVDFGTNVFTVEEHGFALMKFEGGLNYYWERANNAHNVVPNQTRIYGTRGGLRFSYTTDSNEVEYFYIDKEGHGKAKSEILKVDMSQHKNDMYQLGQAFINVLLRKGPVPMPLALEVKNLEIIHKVYKTAGWT
ncbi:MAG TPA: Gfo/Idh/MocA family oxidoreductase [Candidatus Omnitrophica bacterium]|nr:Gfo/Idh/MocA family oxidoreductase [Candidatus Omnitrophota bacterium]